MVNSQHSTYFIFALWAIALTIPALAQPVAIEKGVRQLFFDDYAIASRENLTQTLHSPEKHPDNPVLKREHPWEAFRVQVYGTVIHDPFTDQFKAWYMNIPALASVKINVQGQSRPGHATLLSYATSADGVHWEKPVLNLVDFEGSTENNMIAPDLYNPEGFSALYEPQDPDPDRRYKAFYWDHGFGPLIMHEGQEIYGSGPKDGMHVAFSPDGIHWTPYAGNPVREEDSDSGQVVLYDPDLKKYVAYGRFGAGGRKTARMESADFVHWSDPKLVLEPDAQDGPNTQFYGISIDRYDDLYIGMLWMFYIDHTNVGRINFQLCHSRDGIHWQRDPERRTFMDNGPPDAWDANDMRAACRAVILEDRVLIYYAGSRAHHGTGGMGEKGMDIGLATLRRDGWVSLDAGDTPGILRTRPFVHPGGDLYLNVDAAAGSVKARLIGAGGAPLPGFASAHPITADALAARVDFDRAGESPEGKAVQIELEMQHAQLYSFWFN
jgi:hypothetical protein